MSGAIEQAVPRQAAFRSRATGEVIATGPCHDIIHLPGGLEADLDEWQAGFADIGGRFLDRGEAAAVVGCEGRLEAPTSRATPPFIT